MRQSDILPFVLAGNSTFTVHSIHIGRRYTYNIRKDSKHSCRYFAKVLYGSDNTKDYMFLGWFYRDNLRLLCSDKSCSEENDMRFKMLHAFLQMLWTGDLLPTCQFYPSGKCGRCGRLLTTPESIEVGLGPICRRHVCE